MDVFVPGLNGSSLGGELPLDPFFFFFWFFEFVEEGELLEDEWEGFIVCCCYCELFGPLFFPLAFFFVLTGCLLLLLVWLSSTLSSAVTFTA